MSAPRPAAFELVQYDAGNHSPGAPPAAQVRYPVPGREVCEFRMRPALASTPVRQRSPSTSAAPAAAIRPGRDTIDAPRPRAGARSSEVQVPCRLLAAAWIGWNLVEFSWRVSGPPASDAPSRWRTTASVRFSG